MPHSKMQSYVNIDYSQTTSIVGYVDIHGQEKIISEARFVMNNEKTFADIAFVVDAKYQNIGIATYMYQRLIELAKNEGLKGFTADVLSSNKEMMRVFSKGDLEVNSTMEDGIFSLTITFS